MAPWSSSLLLAMLVHLPAPALQPVAVNPQVVGGAVAATCAWPSVVELDLGPTTPGFRGVCSGTLVAPQLVVYAAHCGSTVANIIFGETDSHPARVVQPVSCALFPGHTLAAGNDVAYCTLAAPIRDIPIVPILMGCEAAAIREGRSVVEVGFGADDAGNEGTKHAVTTVQHQVDAMGAFIGGGGKDTCHGDSGGPAFVQLDASDHLPGSTDGSWRIYGVTSSGSGDQCGAGGHDSLIYPAVPWIESTSGMDVTPCFDADGTWDPGPACADFPTQPQASGSWDEACVSASIGAAAATCGAAYTALPPRVQIVSPAASDHLAPDAALTVVVSVTAESATVASVQVTLDGTALPAGAARSDGALSFGPVTATVGTHALLAAATDARGNIGSQQATLTVDASGAVHVANGSDYAVARPAGCAALQGHAALGLAAAALAVTRRLRRRRRRQRP